MTSFKGIDKWIKNVKDIYYTNEITEIPLSERLPFIALIGNKTDLKDLRVVTLEDHIEYAQENDIESFLVSSTDVKNRNELISVIRSMVIDYLESVFYLSNSSNSKGDKKF